MRRPKLILITPIWAQQIEVEKRGNILHVTGWGRLVDPFDAKQIAPDQVSSIDIFHRFRRYALRHLNGRRTGEDAGIYQFADATTDAKLIAFVQEFGPVMGKVLSTTIEDNGTMTITVEQSMERLRQEQREFAGAVTLVQQVNKKRNTYGRGLRGIVSGNVRCSSSRNLDDDDEQFSLNPRLHQAEGCVDFAFGTPGALYVC